MELGKEETERVKRWYLISQELYGQLPLREGCKQALLMLNGQEIQPRTAAVILWLFSLENREVPTTTLDALNFCDFCSVLVENRLGLQVGYDALQGRIYVSECKEPRDYHQWFRTLLETAPTAAELGLA